MRRTVCAALLFSCSPVAEPDVQSADNDNNADADADAETDTASDIDGESDADTEPGYNDSLTPIESTWDILTGPLDIGRGSVMGAYNDKLYVFGGSGDFIGTRTQIYNIDTDAWSFGASMPNYRESAVLALLGDQFYVIGGNDPDTCSGEYRCAQLASVDIYSAGDGTWSTGPALNERRDVAGAVVIEGRIYVVGGMYSEATDANVDNRATVEIFDPDLGAWQLASAAMPYPIRSAATVAVGTDIYVFGGCARDEDTALLGAAGTCQQHVVQKYDTVADAWIVLASEMPTGRHFSGQHAAIAGDWILVYGGSTDFSAVTYDVVELMDWASGLWTFATPMWAARKSSASVVHEGFLYVVGGGNQESEYDLDMERLDLSSFE